MSELTDEELDEMARNGALDHVPEGSDFMRLIAALRAARARADRMQKAGDWLAAEVSPAMSFIDKEMPEQPTLRDQFAMTALSMLRGTAAGSAVDYANALAEAAYVIADAMLEARAKEDKP